MDLSGKGSYLLVRGDALRLPFPDQSVSLVFGSPPYLSARQYLEGGRDLGIARGFEDWVSWMLAVTEEALRVSRGAVVWVAAGVTRGRNYQPACEALMSDWYRRKRGSGVWEDGIELPGDAGSMYRTCYWHRSGIPGSGGDQWFRADVEYVMCFKRPGPLPWTDNVACGNAPKFRPGGNFSHRQADGLRVGLARAVASGKPLVKVTRRKQGVDRRDENEYYVPPDVANPGNVIKTSGGHLGSEIAHASEAPFPEDLAEHFIRSLCPPGGTVLDVFSGSGTTAATAARLGRRGIGIDLRQSQCELGARRIAAGLRPESKLDGPKPVKPLAGQLSFLEGA